MCGDRNLTRNDELEIDVLDRDRFVSEIAHMSKVEGAFVLASVQKDASRNVMNHDLRTSICHKNPYISYEPKLTRS